MDKNGYVKGLLTGFDLYVEEEKTYYEDGIEVIDAPMKMICNTESFEVIDAPMKMICIATEAEYDE